jgi:prepilin-type N-terminal cleavage/methylation domain-containing protein
MAYKSKGFGLIELIVAAVILSIIMLATFATVMSSRNAYTVDQSRSSSNQNLRAALDILGADIRQSGARIAGTGVSAVSLTSTSLTLRFGLADPLPICQNASGQSVSIYIQGSSIAGCNSAVTQGIIAQWQNLYTARNTSGQIARIWIYDRITAVGEFAQISNISSSSTLSTISTLSNLSRTYIPANTLVYLIEEHAYTFSSTNRTLSVAVDAQAATVVVDQVDSFQVQATTTASCGGASSLTSSGSFIAGSSCNLRNIVLTIQSSNLSNGRQIAPRTLQGIYIPRNVL